MQTIIPNTQYPRLTIQNILQQTRIRLTAHTDTPSLDAQVLLAHITGKPRTWLLAHPETLLNTRESQQLEEALQKLESGLPLPYLLGTREFYGLKFKVTPATLIPRPETELLVETAINWLNRFPFPLEREARGERLLAADIGTGSGCIAVALAVHCPQLHVVATDLSPAALTVAQHNAQAHHVADRLTFLKADLLISQSPISNLQLLCANLPYIPTSTLHTLAVHGREPTLALDGGPDGLTLIRRLLAQAVPRLAPGGLILLEVEATQGQPAQALAYQHFPHAQIQVRPDLAGHDRLLVIQTPSSSTTS